VIAVGLMSGTSLDGIDAALVEILPRGSGYEVALRRFVTTPFDEELQSALVAALPPNAGSAEALATLHHRLGLAFGNAATRVMEGERASFVASHGQTIWHDGERSTTLQLGDAFLIREATETTVCYDFRSADCAAGGSGAPLVPYVDVLLFRDRSEDRVALNLGGIANLTALPGTGDGIVAFDTGPGNMLVDAFVRERTAGARTYDRGGALAARGRVDDTLLRELLSDPYFSQTPPKSTGRERFGTQFLRAHPNIDALTNEDALATLVELTAASVAQAIASLPLHHPRVIVSGGGARNLALLARLRARLAGSRVETSDVMGISADAKEALAFAVLGYETLRERAGNLPRATGAKRHVPLGAIAPHELRSLLDAVERECANAGA
jgi:anhydro-N-acetylmuramic acid kinase